MFFFKSDIGNDHSKMKHFFLDRDFLRLDELN